MPIRSSVSHALAIALTLVMSGCNDAPVAGTVLLDADLSSETEGATVNPTTAAHEAELPLGGRVEVRSHLASDAEGGQYITQIEVVVVDAAGFEMSAELQGNPVNEGTGTGAEVRMARTVMVSQDKAGLTGTTRGQTSIRVRSDGSIDLD